MSLPKVKFLDAPLSKEIDWMHGFLFQNKWGWGKYIIEKHPKIKKVYSIKSELKQVEFLKQYIITSKKKNRELIDKNKSIYCQEWKTIEKVFLDTLSEILQIEWPKNKKVIKAMVSINPLCPRFLEDWSFFIFYDYKKLSHAIEVIMHECCHFLYFEKWRALYPKINNNKFESPYIEWHLSELLAPIILNDVRIQKLLKHKAVFYPEHQKITIDRKSAPKYFTDLYNKTIKNGDFEEFLKKSFEAIKKREDLFKT